MRIRCVPGPLFGPGDEANNARIVLCDRLVQGTAFRVSASACATRITVYGLLFVQRFARMLQKI